MLQKSASTIGLTGAFKANPRRAAFQDLSNNGRHTIREEASITSRLRQATITQVRDPAPAQEPKDAQRPWPSAYLQHDIQNRPDALVGLAARSDVVGARRRGTSLISTAQEAGCIQQGAKEAFLQPPQKLTSVAKGGYVTHPPSTAGTRLIHGNESQRPDGARPYPASKKTMPIWCDQTVVPEQGPHHQALPDAPANGRETVSEVGLAADLLRSIVDDQDVSQQPQPQPQPQPQQAIRHFKSQPQLKAQPGAHVLRRTKSRIPAQIKEMESEVLTQDEIDQRVVDQLVDEGFSVVSYPESEPIDNLPEDMASPISCHEDNYEIGAPSSTSEPEEYWDEEEDEDQGDEQGYVTAHSTKSRAESTTGAATTVVLPVFTSRERELLEIAEKDVINKITPQELEDDMYDISMVAEYSDEIFEYMRELEVSLRGGICGRTELCVAN